MINYHLYGSMKISVVIPAYNEEHYIRSCLESILRQTENPDEIIVVDNNSTDATSEIVKKFSQVTLIHESVQGMTPCRNAGFNAAKYDIIARTDADTVVPKNWIKKIKKHFENSDTIAIAGPAKFTDLDPVRAQAYWQSEALFFKSFRSVLHHNSLFGPNMAIRKDAWEKIKQEVCMSDKIVHEDIDLAIHLAPLGEIVFDKALVVSSSSRRWKKIQPHFEYPYRYLRTLQHHNRYLIKIKEQTESMKKAFPKTRKMVKRITASIRHPLRLED